MGRFIMVFALHIKQSERQRSNILLCFP